MKSWDVCLEINTGLVMVQVTDVWKVSEEAYQDLLAGGVHLPRLNGMRADEVADVVGDPGTMGQFLNDCKDHPFATVSVRG